MARAVSSTSSRARIQAALAFLTQHAADAELTIVAASRGAADELARALVAERGATFGVSRYGFNELVARLAAPVLARARLAPERSASRPWRLERRSSRWRPALLRAGCADARLPAVRGTRNVGELALAGVEARRLAALGDSGADLADLDRVLRAETERSGLVGRADGTRRGFRGRRDEAASLRQAGPSSCSTSRLMGHLKRRSSVCFSSARAARSSPSRQTIA